MSRRIWAFVAATSLLAAVAPAGAHHSFSAEFDADAPGELSGQITAVWFNNPHARFELQTKGADGVTQKWELQASSVTTLQQLGWTAQTLKPGDQVKVTGQLGRNGAKKLFIRGLQRPDGTQLMTSRDARGAPDPDVVSADPNKNYAYGALRTAYPADITGAWRNGYKFRVTVDDLTPKPTPFTAEGRRVFAATEHWHDAALRCMPPGLPRIFGSPYNMEIIDAGSHYVMIHVEHNNPRRIWMDGRKAPANTPATSLGFSVGHWEDDALVIETTHLLPAWLDGSGLPMSGEGTRIVERFDVSDDRLSIDRTMTIYDPYYTQPLVRVRGSARGDDVEIAEQAGCDPDGYYRDLLEDGHLEEHLQIQP